LAFTPIQLSKGWNLMGNSDPGSINVASTLGVSGVTTVWKWTPQGKWAFYTTQLSAVDLAAYAQSKGYEVLTSINPKEGYWVNASADTTISAGALETPPSVGSSPTLLTEADLALGWNLLASADAKTPAQLNTALTTPLSSANKSISTVWAWDVGSGKWRFYAPSLAAMGANALADYITSKNYLGFTGAMGVTEGFWVNVAAVGTSTPPTAQEIVTSFLASVDAAWATAVPSTGAVMGAFLDACYLNGGTTKALDAAGFDNNLPNSISWSRYRIGSKRIQAQVLADRTSTNPDGSSRRELDVQYRIDYTDGTSDVRVC